MYEPYIIVKHADTQLQNIWNLEKFSSRLTTMRDVHARWSNASDKQCEQFAYEFCESCENHNLIGVGNLYLNALFSDCQFNCMIPIVNQQGE